MTHTLPALPYALDALAPHLSAETLDCHWGKHHRAYVDALNRLIAGSPLSGLRLEELVLRSSGAVFNNAAQHFNHGLYWRSLSPKGGGEPAGALREAMLRGYGSLASFRNAFTEQAGSHFGSGWAWLVQRPDGSARIEVTHDAGCPLMWGDSPLLALDLWEHAYYIDYRNRRARYLESFWMLVDWRRAESAFADEATSAAVAAASSSGR